MTTSDGISDADWEIVIEMAAAVANATAEGADSGLLKKKMLRELDRLEKKYGRLTSILSTKADYVDGPPFRLCLLKEAYSTASENSDFKNKVFVSSAIAELYIEEFNDSLRANYWVGVLKRDLENYPEDEYFQELYRELLDKVSLT